MITNTEQPGLGMVEDGTQCGDGKVRSRSQFSTTKRHYYESNENCLGRREVDETLNKISKSQGNAYI